MSSSLVRGPLFLAWAALAVFAAACSGASSDAPGGTPPNGVTPEGTPDGAVPGTDGGTDAPAPPCTKTPEECAAIWEEAASSRYDAAMKTPADRKAFLKAVPKGADLHNHLSGAVYAETFLAWGKADNNCINTTSYVAAFGNACNAGTQPVPTSGDFYDAIVRAWSMKDFVPGGAETGRDHFFATFGKFGSIAGFHRDDSIADLAKRAADENQVHVETMFNLGKNIGTLSGTLSVGTLTADGLPALYDAILADSTFAAKLASDVAVVTSAGNGYKTALGCGSSSEPAACKVGVRFVAQVARTGANDEIFGQLISAFEMASKTPLIVAANLSSPEDDTRSLNNYALHMAMLDFLYQKYTVTKTSPLHVTLHAGELVPKYLPPAHASANTFHIRQAVEIGHAERIGHGLDVLSETDSAQLLDAMRTKGVLVEVCLSSNDQILEVKGTDHPLAEYLKKGVAVSLATDDQGVSRSSLAGEYERAALDQKLTYRQLKTMARQSLEHAFLPGASLWSSVGEAKPVEACARTATMGLGDTPNATCKTLLDASERATAQWELERRFLAFESKQ